MWNNVGEEKKKKQSKWHLKGKWKFKISSSGSIFCADGFGWKRGWSWSSQLSCWDRSELCPGQGSSTLHLSTASRCCSVLGSVHKPLFYQSDRHSPAEIMELPIITFLSRCIFFILFDCVKSLQINALDTNNQVSVEHRLYWKAKNKINELN